MSTDHDHATWPQPLLGEGSIVLRPPRPEDKETKRAFGRNAEYLRLDGDDPRNATSPTPDELDGWYALFRDDPHRWIIAVDGRCAGFARFHTFRENNRRAEYAVGLYDPATWGRGIGTMATRIALRYAFEALHLHRVELRVVTFNARAIACYEKCGFVREGIERDGVWVAEAWQSYLIMSILEQEYARLSPAW